MTQHEMLFVLYAAVGCLILLILYVAYLRTKLWFLDEALRRMAVISPPISDPNGIGSQRGFGTIMGWLVRLALIAMAIIWIMSG